MRYILTPIETPRAFAVDEIDAYGRLNRRIKVFAEDERKKAVLLVYRLNSPYLSGTSAPVDCECHQ